MGETRLVLQRRHREGDECFRYVTPADFPFSDCSLFLTTIMDNMETRPT